MFDRYGFLIEREFRVTFGLCRSVWGWGVIKEIGTRDDTLQHSISKSCHQLHDPYTEKTVHRRQSLSCIQIHTSSLSCTLISRLAGDAERAFMTLG